MTDSDGSQMINMLIIKGLVRCWMFYVLIAELCCNVEQTVFITVLVQRVKSNDKLAAWKSKVFCCDIKV